MRDGPGLVSILRQGDYLVASVHTALDDSEMLRFSDELVVQIGVTRARGVVIDVAALDVIDSFALNSLKRITEMARLRGAASVLVGVRPEVALTLVRLGMGGDIPCCALDLEDGLALLDTIRQGTPGR